jgi:hypothetical protein
VADSRARVGRRARSSDARRRGARGARDVRASREDGGEADREGTRGARRAETRRPGASEILRFITERARLERLARGEPENVSALTSAPTEPQEPIRSMMEGDPEIARASVRLSAQILRCEREQQEAAEQRAHDDRAHS